MPEPALVSPLYESIREPGQAHISPKLLSRQLDMSLTSLSEVVHVHRNSFRNPRSETVQTRLREIARIIGRSERMLGSRARAVYWFRNQPLQDYGGRTAEELVADGAGSAVLAHLDDVETGALG